MIKRLFIILMISTGLMCINAKNYVVSPTGISTGLGTLVSPYDITTGLTKPAAGDTVLVRGGIYNLASSVTVSKIGTAINMVHVIAYGNELPIFDFRTQVYGSSSQGVKISGNYIHFAGITVQGAGDNGVQVTGSFNKIEHCTLRWNCDSGLQMKTGSDNLILNCDSYENFDYKSGSIDAPDFGGNADGFADKQYTNTGVNTYRGCRSWNNSDDGWDSFEKIGNTVYDNSWCYANGPATFDMTDNIRFKTDSATWFYQFKNADGRYVMINYGNGNGFKLGGNFTANNTTLTNCVSVANKVKGFDQNNNNGTMTVYNCTGYNNGNNYGFSNSNYGVLVIKNCASLASKNSNSFSAKTVTQAYNTWNTGFTCVAGDFVSLDAAQMLYARKNDGSLPDITLLHLTASSGLKDKGTNLGYPFNGTAPDLGAFELSTTTAVNDAVADEVSVRYVPANSQILVCGSIAAVELYQISGVKIFALHQSTESMAIPTTNRPSGVYILRIITQSGACTNKKVLIN